MSAIVWQFKSYPSLTEIFDSNGEVVKYAIALRPVRKSLRRHPRSPASLAFAATAIHAAARHSPTCSLSLIAVDHFLENEVKSKGHPSGPEILRMMLRRIESGRFRPGDRLVPAVLSRDFGSSPIPVREALCQLVGREIVVEQRHKGFFVAPMTSTTLRALYAAHGIVIEMALRLLPPGKSLRNRTRNRWRLFTAITRHSENDAIAGLQRHLAGRLALVRKHETAHFSTEGMDWAIDDALHHGRVDNAIELSRKFHEACEISSPRIWQMSSVR